MVCWKLDNRYRLFIPLTMPFNRHFVPHRARESAFLIFVDLIKVKRRTKMTEQGIATLYHQQSMADQLLVENNIPEDKRPAEKSVDYGPEDVVPGGPGDDHGYYGAEAKGAYPQAAAPFA